MPTVIIKTQIKADTQTCFDLSRNIDFHKSSMKQSNEKAIAGKISGLIGLGEWVTWEAKHFGINQQLTSKITEFESPDYFVDDMVSGAFKSFKHEHLFASEEKETLMVDKFHFESPFGIFGRLANTIFLKRYMTNLLTTRCAFIKQKAEELAHIS
jgi:ligand-binding SRPBCC domain-containing protein